MKIIGTEDIFHILRHAAIQETAPCCCLMVTRCLTSATADCSMTNFSINIFSFFISNSSPLVFDIFEEQRIWVFLTFFRLQFQLQLQYITQPKQPAWIIYSWNCSFPIFVFFVDIFHGSVDEYVARGFHSRKVRFVDSMTFSLEPLKWRQFIYVLNTKAKVKRDVC